MTISIALAEGIRRLICCNAVNGCANRIGIVQPRPIALPRISNRGEIEVHEPLD